MDVPIENSDLVWLRRLAFALVSDEHTAEDLAQDTVLAALERPRPAGVPLRAWLRGIARRRAVRRHRDLGRQQDRERQAARPELSDTDDLAERAETAERLLGVVRGLDEPLRSTLLLRFMEGRTPKDIATIQSAPVDTVRWRLRRGLQETRTRLQESDDRGWEAWSLSLAPLAAEIPSLGSGASAAFSAPGALAGASSLLFVMKLAVLVGASAALLLVGARFLPEPDRGPLEDDVAGPLIDDPVPVEETRLATGDLVVPEANVATEERQDLPGSVGTTRAAWASGSVVDSQGVAVTLASVRFFNASDLEAEPDDQPIAASARARTDMEGQFAALDGPAETASNPDASWEIVVLADGFTPYRRRVQEDLSGIEVVLSRGERLVGRVVDQEGRPVPDLLVMAAASEARVSHMSTTQMQARAERALEDPRKAFASASGRTAANGAIELFGLQSGVVDLVSLDPAWRIIDPARPSVPGSDLLIRAVPCLGCRVTAVEADKTLTDELLRATFRIRLYYDDGNSELIEQWVGRGVGGVSTSLAAADVGAWTLENGSLENIKAARFEGEVRGEGWQASFESNRLITRGGPGSLPMGVARATVDRGAARAEAEIEAASSGTPLAENLPRVWVDLDVRFTDGTPPSQRLAVEWRGSGQLRGSAEPTPKGPGRYRVRMPKTMLAVEAHLYGESGSMEGWETTVNVAELSEPLQVTLQRGARVTLERPLGSTGDWGVRAQYREGPDDEWFGAWGYGTHEDTLTLSALRPAEWRFEIRPDSDVAQEPEVRTVVVEEGDDVRI